jgi:hypothetical protein
MTRNQKVMWLRWLNVSTIINWGIWSKLPQTNKGKIGIVK